LLPFTAVDLLADIFKAACRQAAAHAQSGLRGQEPGQVSRSNQTWSVLGIRTVPIAQYYDFEMNVRAQQFGEPWLYPVAACGRSANGDFADGKERRHIARPFWEEQAFDVL
jgi:hypothetical protein